MAVLNKVVQLTVEGKKL